MNFNAGYYLFWPHPTVFFSFHGKVDWCSTIQFCLSNIVAVILVPVDLLTGQSNTFTTLFGLLCNDTDSHWSGRTGYKVKSIWREFERHYVLKRELVKFFHWVVIKIQKAIQTRGV
jgi:hypothetical protein